MTARSETETFAIIVKEHNEAWIHWQNKPETADNHTYTFELVALARDGACDLIRASCDLPAIGITALRDRLHPLTNAILLDITEHPGYVNAANLTWERTRAMLESFKENASE